MRAGFRGDLRGFIRYGERVSGHASLGPRLRHGFFFCWKRNKVKAALGRRAFASLRRNCPRGGFSVQRITARMNSAVDRTRGRARFQGCDLFPVPGASSAWQFYITYMLYAVAGRPRVLIQKPLQTLDKFPGFRTGGLPRLLRPERQWDSVNQGVDAIHPLEDLAKRHGFRSCSDRSLALAYVNSGAQELLGRGIFWTAAQIPRPKTSLRASIDNACSGRWWRRMSFFLGKSSALSSGELGLYRRSANHFRSCAAVREACAR